MAQVSIANHMLPTCSYILGRQKSSFPLGHQCNKTLYITKSIHLQLMQILELQFQVLFYSYHHCYGYKQEDLFLNMPIINYFDCTISCSFDLGCNIYQCFLSPIVLEIGPLSIIFTSPYTYQRQDWCAFSSERFLAFSMI